MNPINLDTVVKVRSNAMAERLGDEIAILDPDSGLYFGLNEVGARIWSLLEQPRKLHEVSDAILEEYDVDPARCRANVLLLVGKLLETKLVEVTNENAG